MPSAACDCHVHVIGPAHDYPMHDARAYTPAEASLNDLRAHKARLGLGRAVLVQPSVYGIDNRYMLACLQHMGGTGRGIAVIDAAHRRELLEQWHALGVRGVRVNLESAGARDLEAAWAMLEHTAQQIAPLKWHLQVYAAYSVLRALSPRLLQLPVPLVLDHFAMVPAEWACDAVALEPLEELLSSGRVYIKLSGSYRLSDVLLDSLHAADILAARWLALRPDRLLWGSDWPHTARDPGKHRLEVSAYRNIASDGLHVQALTWFPTPEIRQQVMVINPQQLYGFEGAVPNQ
ncbi:amidohydrolase [Lampropedia puyangensis]|uniref:Amidohydrolase n=1 Tax=Lampropedia puyangensis TaxID=1330072 RepID=A0A4V4GRV4_9BURK|nr:amidohydrolase [Lampropedia puyangensis]